MNRDALFSDGTSGYVIPPEPKEYETVTLRFRTARDEADSVTVCTKNGRYEMQKAFTRGPFDYYECGCRLGAEPFSYYF